MCISALRAALVAAMPSAGPRTSRSTRAAVSSARRLARHHPVVEADALGLVGLDELAGQQQLGGLGQADHPGEQVGDAHVGAGEADLHEEERDLGGVGGHPQVGGEGDGRTRARARGR